MAGTGTGASLLHAAFGVSRQNEFRALAKAVELLVPGALTLFEMGGENSKYILFERDEANGRLGIVDYQTNGDCAAGTGGFLDQQAGRLRFTVEEIGDIVLRDAAGGADCGPLLGVRQERHDPRAAEGILARGDPEGAVRRGRPQLQERHHQGQEGRARRSCSWAAWRPTAASCRRSNPRSAGSAGTLIVPQDHTSFGAIGSALLAEELARDSGRATASFSLDRLPADAHQFPTSPRLTMDNVVLLRDQMTAVDPRDIHDTRDAFLGIDIGSVSTNLAVIDADCNVLKEIYLRTDARPIEAVSRGLREIERDLGGKIRIRGVGTTGSGRELIGELVGADTVNDEITAHKTGAAFIDRTILGLGVDTIFEIGGQDAKFISLEEGIVVDFAMNEACAAGTGSFLEERAKELGIRIEEEFARIALSSEQPIKLGERCTVFMERDVNSYLQRGAELEKLVAGLAYSVATNYINRVVRGRKIGEVIFFQGGTAYNDAVAAAFSSILGKRIIVPPFNGVMGAVGSALLARDKMMGRGGDERVPRLRSRQGRLPDPRVHVQGMHQLLPDAALHGRGREHVLGRQVLGAVSQGRQGGARARRRESRRVQAAAAARGLRPGVRQRPGRGRALLHVHVRLGAVLVQGLPRARREDAALRADDEPDREARARIGGLRAVLPGAGRARAHPGLIEKNVDLIFVPNNIAAPGSAPDRPSFFCPWNQTLPFVVRTAPFISEVADRILAPTAWFNLGTRTVAEELRRALKAAGISRTASQVERAVQQGFDKLNAFRRSLIEAGSRALAAIERHDEHGIILLGRPYNIYDKGINLDIATKMRTYYGANVVGLDFLDVDAIDFSRYHENMFWSYGVKILAAAAFVRDKPKLHIVYITNFKCGPDSYIKHYITEVSGRPFLTLQFDGHNNDAGMLTRCEAYLDSKGVLRRWGSTQQPVAVSAGSR